VRRAHSRRLSGNAENVRRGGHHHPFDQTETVTAGPTAPPPSFGISILIDLDSEPVPAEGLATALEEASALLQEPTRFVFTVLEVVEGRPPASIDDWVSAYLASKAPPIPNGVVVFSYGEGDLARSRSGYSSFVPGPPGYRP
jgi:hypothetical protein